MKVRKPPTSALSVALVSIVGAVTLLTLSPAGGGAREIGSAVAAVQPTARAAAPTSTPEPPEAAPTAAEIELPAERELTPEPTPIFTAEPLPTRDIVSMLGIDPKPLVCANPQGKLTVESLTSKLLARPLPVQVWTPPCYDPDNKRYPVLYLMHGNAVAYGGWVDRQRVNTVANDLMAAGAIPPFIIVMPASDIAAGGRSEFNFSSSGKGTWEDLFVNDLLPLIERKYSTWTNREGRAIGGISRGGFWSIEIGFANPDKFGIVGGHSPSIFQFLVGVKPSFTMLQYTPSLDALRAQRIWLDAGDRDWARNDAARLSKELTAQEIDHIFTLGKGGHDDTTWASRVGEYLAFYSLDWPYEPVNR